MKWERENDVYEASWEPAEHLKRAKKKVKEYLKKVSENQNDQRTRGQTRENRALGVRKISFHEAVVAMESIKNEVDNPPPPLPVGSPPRTPPPPTCPPPD